MKLRERLKADFGIDVRIASGNGLQADPFVIEACSVDEATQTQLDLMRGLGMGRNELWRILDAELLRGGNAPIQRLRIETVTFTPDQVITESRAYHFDLSSVKGLPTPESPRPAWSYPTSRFAADHQIGWLHFVKAVDNRPDDGRFDFSLVYSGRGAKATLYVYEPELPSTSLPGASRALLELQSVCEQVKQLQPAAETPWPIATAEPFLLQHFLIGDDLSIAGVCDLGAHFLKLRLTFTDDPKMRELMGFSISELRHQTLRCLQRR
jgi:hypothetical protein